MSDLDVLYVSGAPRSGTTLFGMMMGQLPGACDVGELWALWRPAYRNGDLCGCGVPVRQCPFWLEVVEQALGPDFEARGLAIGDLHRRHLGTLSAPQVWLHVTGRRRRPEYERYAAALGEHYRAIAQVAGARVVVDSSKMASDALLASSLGGVRLSVVHVVRDPRGVAWSWRKQMRQPGPNGREMNQRGTLATAARWDAYNAFADWLLAPRLGPRFTTVRYEDLMTDPAGVLTRLAGWMGLPTTNLPVSGVPPRLTMTKATHPVWGNPVRTSTGNVALAEDRAWRRGLSDSERLGVTLATWPWLLRYHYPRS